ncbi:MAG: hypothetical protein HAW63_02855 [Bdellovibrionaceae bacterium]|nr:hypothetical protein [Pseudobdellovibrionaceae bacterium]
MEIVNDESGQGTTEYILILVAIVAVAVLFKDKITTALEGKLGSLETSINGFQ